MNLVFKRLLASVIYLLTILLSTSPALHAADELTQDELVAMVIGCERLEHDYAIYRDRGDAEAFANIFTEDGEWARSNGRIIKGRPAIIEYVNSLDHSEPEAHMQLTGTVQIKPVDATTANGVSYAIVLEAPITETGLPATNNSFQVGSESRSVYKLTDNGWKIAKREYTTLFVDPE
jgi:uncharacterized protein (TIGR02246 family)